MRVLVVEDERKLASYIAKGLKQAGFAVDCADNGEDGLRMALETSYDAAVIDVMLPKIGSVFSVHLPLAGEGLARMIHVGTTSARRAERAP